MEAFASPLDHDFALLHYLVLPSEIKLYLCQVYDQNDFLVAIRLIPSWLCDLSTAIFLFMATTTLHEGA